LLSWVRVRHPYGRAAASAAEGPSCFFHGRAMKLTPFAHDGVTVDGWLIAI
jgi:hypothetical protein